MVSIGIVTGPTLGGLLIGAFSWHWIFLVNLPIGIIGILVGLRYLPMRHPPGGQRFDFTGAVTLCVSLMAFLVALTLGQETSFTALPVLGLLILAAAGLAVFIALERRVRFPMVDLTMFRNVQFSTNLATGFLIFVATSGMTLLLPFLLEGVKGYPVSTVGLLLAVVPIAVGTLAPISGSLSDRLGSRPITVVGLLTIVAGFLGASTLTLQTGIAGYVLRFLPIGIGLGIFQSPNTSALMGAAPRERLGVASGLLSNTRTLGQVTGIALLGAFWAGRVAAHAGADVGTGATQAPAEVQMAAFHDTLLVMAGLAAVSLALALRALVLERRHGLRQAPHTTPAD
jgi:MFS family permease